MTEKQWNQVNAADGIAGYTLTLFVDGRMIVLEGNEAIEMLERFAQGLGMEA